MSGTVASPLAIRSHLKVFEDMAIERTQAIDLEALLVYLVDIVKPDALLPLASQFDVLGYKGWILTDSETERRELIKNAINLHRYKGTPYAVRTAIESLGFGSVEILERVAASIPLFDGSIDYDGFYYYGGATQWATFSVNIDMTDVTFAVPVDMITLIKELIDEYKAARCHLVKLIFSLDFTDSLSLSEEFTPGIDDPELEDLTLALLYDGEALYDGSRQYDNDILEITVIPVP